MTLSDELAWRGFIKDRTFENTSWLNQPRTFYHGIDGSAESLTIGNLAALMLARHLMAGGWKGILLVGGATSLVGDPGGKESERLLPNKDVIARNVEAIRSQIERLFADQAPKVVNNIDWLGDLKVLDFLRDVGKNYSMTELMQRDFVSDRMNEGGNGISYAEFSYTLIQGYDFWHLFKNHQAQLQIGGSDQWGNMLSGVALIRKKEAKEAHAMSMPLVTNKATGRKFGKTEEGAIWLDTQKTTSTQFYQFWINVDDQDVEDYLKIFTLLPKKKIDSLMSQHQNDPGARKAQQALAEEITKLVHGEASSAATSVTKYLTSQVSLTGASASELDEIKKEIPSIQIRGNAEDIHFRQTLVDVGLANSRTDANRLIEEGAIYINGEKYKRGDRSGFRKGPNLLRRGKAYKDSALLELL